MISTQPFFQWRGSPIRVKCNLLALESLGMDVDLLTMPFGEDDRDIQSPIYRVPGLPGVRNIPIGPSLPKLVLDVFLLFKATWLAVRRRYDVIHATEEGGAIAWVVARLTGARCIYEKHSDPASYDKQGLRRLVMKAYRGFEAFVARRADSVICTGPGLERQARGYAPAAAIFQIPDIPSSIDEPDAAEVARLAEELRENDREVLVTYVGSFAVYQGIDMVFDAIPLVVSRHPRARFLIIGGSPGEIEHYRHELGGAKSRVRFEGLVAPDRLPAYLRASDILLAPRRAGINTPLKILDYFKAGGAIVATDTEANRLILDPSCARLCRFDAGDFADAIGDLIEHPDKRRSLAQEGLDRYRTRYNFNLFRAQLAHVYRGLLGESVRIDEIPD